MGRRLCPRCRNLDVRRSQRRSQWEWLLRAIRSILIAARIAGIGSYALASTDASPLTPPGLAGRLHR